MDLYTCHKVSEDHWMVSKIEDTFEHPTWYDITRDGKKYRCTCPNRVQPCKHVNLLKQFEEAGHLGTGHFLDSDGKWYEPVTGQ